MESRRKTQIVEDDDSEFWYIGGTTLLNPTYDTPVSRWLSSTIKWVASSSSWFGQPTLFSPGTDVKFLKIEDTKTPSVCKNFKEYYERVAPNPENRKYVQWSGDLGLTAWKKTVAALRLEVIKKLETRTSEKPLQLHIVAHSHGGQIARLLAEEFKDIPQVEFHVATVETPLSIIPPLKMPENVKTWQHFYHKEDVPAKMGSIFMQSESLIGKEDTLASATGLIAFMAAWLQLASSMFARTIKEVLFAEQMDKSGSQWEPYEIKMPSGWGDNEITKKLKDKHNDPVKDPECAGAISHKMLSVLEESKYFDKQPQAAFAPKII